MDEAEYCDRVSIMVDGKISVLDGANVRLELERFGRFACDCRKRPFYIWTYDSFE